MRPYTEEPGAEQFACPVLDWRRMERSIRRPYGKLRRLGIPSIRDKLVQEVVRLILEAIYDSPHGPYFSESSHGFRRSKSCHDAIEKIYGLARPNKTKKWVLDADIKGAFDHASCCSFEKRNILRAPARSCRNCSRVAGSSGNKYKFVCASLLT